MKFLGMVEENVFCWYELFLGYLDRSGDEKGEGGC